MVTDEQRMLADMVGPFLADRGSVARLRALRDRDDPDGFDRDLWKSFADMGLAGMLVPEAFGGAALGHAEAGILLEEIGRNLTPSPFLVTGIGAAIALGHASTKLQQRWLPAIAAGEAVVALALEEGVRHRPGRIAFSADRRVGIYKLNGTKRFVVQGGQADLILLVARTSGRAEEEKGVTLFAIDPATPGLTIENERLVDSSLAARLTFSDVAVGPECIVGKVDSGNQILGPMLAALRTGAAAELVGLASRAFAMTLAYLGERTQFDRPIGSFQALQHRAAHLHAELEIAHATVLKAEAALDGDDAGAAAAAMLAKAVAGSASALAVQEAVQMHGGIGVTDEYDIGFFMKRQRVLAELFGDTDYHVDRLARMQGY